ncbi:hypothetical protein HB779_02135 [Phyllobacterium sp. 628]|uniref:hypothetical protein n=1 Tax=Phyllobacterium sp. 628 TaxID=2718938 RepID=UPI00166276C9|nr:hypothetical protein [Phyllobacterium sp. 628]QND50820.1 hypothetical protein HB779_02135 [Phyllobacterium sp. 628]
MSALFFKVSWPHNVEKYRGFQKIAKRLGLKLIVKNISHMRGVPVFMFYLRNKDGSDLNWFHDIDDIGATLEQMERSATNG